MKKILTSLLVLTALGSIASCSGSKGDSKSFKIGLCNYVSDASLDQICNNIKAELQAASIDGYKFEVNYQNPEADAGVMNQVISTFKSTKVDLMVGVATPVAMAMQSATEDTNIPVVFAAVSDPVGSGLVDSLTTPGGNLTGTSDYLDTNAVLDLIFANDPDAKKIGLLYDLGQDSSTTAINQAKQYLNNKGVTIVEKTGTNTTEITQAASQLIAAGVDAIFTPSDNTVMKAELAIYESLATAGIPHYAGADSFALNGAFCGYGVDYANLGRETGKMVVDILKNKKSVATYPVKTFDNGTATINTETCTALGLNLETVKTTFAPLCTKVETTTTKENFDD